MEPKEYTLNELFENIDKIEIDQIGISNEVEKIAIVNGAFGTYLSISKSFFEENKEQILNLIVEIIKRYKKENINIKSGSLITDDVVRTLSENDNIKEITIAKNNIFDKYLLSENHFNIFKSGNKRKIDTTGVEESLKENFDPMISFNMNKFIYSFYKYNQFQEENISFFSKIPDDSLYVLKYLGENTTAKFYDGSNISKIITTLKKYNIKNRIEIQLDIDDKQRLNKELIELGYLKEDGTIAENIDENVYFIQTITSQEEGKLESHEEQMSLREYLEYESLLYSITSPARNYTPFEKLIYAYDIVKKFKEYNQPKKDNKNLNGDMSYNSIKIKNESRDLYRLLNNNYMVCVGYANFLKDLLDKLNIPNIKQSVNIDLSAHIASKQLREKIGIDEWKKLTPEEKYNLIKEQQIFVPKTAYEGHSRLMVRVSDKKYGIDGIYSSDPTWDNNLLENDYAHILMTEEEVSSSLSKSKLDEKLLLFFAKDMQEFNQMLNKAIDIVIQKAEDYNKRTKERAIQSGREISKNDYQTDELNEFYNFFTEFMKNFKTLFPDESKKIIEKYPCINEKNFGIDSIYNLGDNLTLAIYEIGITIVNRNNNKISQEQLKEGVKEVYKDVYDGGLRDNELEEILRKTEDSKTVENGPQIK